MVRWSGQEGTCSWESRHAIRNPKLVDRFDALWDQRASEEQEEALQRLSETLDRATMIKAQSEDGWCQQLRQAMAGGEGNQATKRDAEQCVDIDGLLFHRDNRKKSWEGQLQLVVPECFRTVLVEELHGGLLSGHFGVDRTLDSVKRRYWWHGMKETVKSVVRGCPECNARNPRQGNQKPLLHAEERTGVPWERVGIDYTDMCMSKEGYSKLLVLIDHATKFVVAKATVDGSANTAAKILFEDLICKYGAPKELWSDRGKSFIGEVAQYVTDLFGIQQKFTSGYHPQTNGLTERFNRTIVESLAKSVNEDKDNWVEMLQPKVFAYNTSVQASTG